MLVSFFLVNPKHFLGLDFFMIFKKILHSISNEKIKREKTKKLASEISMTVMRL